MTALVQRIIHREGGWKLTDDPVDPDLATYGGMRYTTFAAHHDIALLVFCRLARAHDPKLRAAIVDVYDREFVEPFRWVPDSVLQEVLVDTAVLSGTARASRILQAAIGVKVDGEMGSRTMDATLAVLARSGPLVLVMLVTRERAAWYADIVQRKPDRIKFLEGWTRRCLSCVVEAVEAATGR